MRKTKEQIIAEYLSDKNRKAREKQLKGKSKKEISEEMRELARRRWQKK
jgi:hypothetical protein